ncbi:MAG: SAM-dependent methyltransferase [Bacteroidetes bacterium]|jgi:16S rRNA (cytidine1402-2'-O)-methyltransferase|nr:SAM-dependent methyltransferase [Bacteroidota bacterium]
MAKQPRLYLIPNLLAESHPDSVFPPQNLAIVRTLNHFVCEHEKPLRILLKLAGVHSPFDHLSICVYNHHEHDALSCLEPLRLGHDLGLVTDAGCPGIADPGAELVGLAHSLGFPVVPLTGPSSILLSIMASGFSGQQFSFRGYMPTDLAALRKEVLALERRANEQAETQVFIETPYRNQKMFEFLLKHLRPETRLCIAMDLTGPDEWICSQEVWAWKSAKRQLDKKPTVFLLGRV